MAENNEKPLNLTQKNSSFLGVKSKSTAQNLAVVDCYFRGVLHHHNQPTDRLLVTCVADMRE
jgi:hypothetical protein